LNPITQLPVSQKTNVASFGDLFDFKKIDFNGVVTPLGELKYNRQKVSFVIVDGQHRAMAVSRSPIVKLIPVGERIDMLPSIIIFPLAQSKSRTLNCQSALYFFLTYMRAMLLTPNKE
jgi:hypothetical protein